MRIGLLGFGNVGGAVVEALRAHAGLLAGRLGVPPLITNIAVRHLMKPRRVSVDPALLTDDPWSVVQDPGIDLVIEAIGGVEPAGSYLEEALCRRKSVVTANKQLVGARGRQLSQLAADAGCAFAFEASTGGAMPIVRLLQESLGGDRVRALAGVVNGTSNYILTRMERGVQFATAIDEARSAGMTERDPHDDIEGKDAAIKLAVLASLAFGMTVQAGDIRFEGITHITSHDLRAARADGYAIRLVAAAIRRDEGIAAGVAVSRLPRDHPLAGLRGEENGVVVRSDLAGEIFLRGRGAGGMATASAILGDVVAIGSGSRTVPFPCEIARVLPLHPVADPLAAALDAG